MPDRAGQQLGNYRLLRLLGRGGFAEVYLGEHVYLKRRAALKVLHIALEEGDVQHFLAEARVLARLDHPHIVRVHEFAVEQGTPFLVMEYAPRGTLRQQHQRGSLLSLQTTLAYIKQVAAALQYAHNHQVIHRDVKPENMLLDAQQELLLSDFGISLLSPSPEQLSTQEMAGTLPYMAPEQIRGKPVFASDQYSLAVVAYEWLCGVRPFEGSSWQVASQQVSLAPPPLRGHDPSLPEAVEAVVLKALAKDPRARYVSVQLFAQAFERACQGSLLDLDAGSAVTTALHAPSPVASSTPPAAAKRVLLSSAPEDEAFAARITSDLRQRGVAVWNEEPHSTQHLPEQENAVRQAVRKVEVVLLVVSPATPSSRSVREHLRIASLYQRKLVFVWVGGEEIADALPPAWSNKAVQIDLIDAREERYEEALKELLADLEAEAPVEEPSLPEPAAEPRNPYKGLRPFTQRDAADFFGRDALIEELVGGVENVRTSKPPDTPQARLLAVIGPSGSGKSSVVMAGLLPRLQQGALPGSEHWVYLEPMVPGTHPLEALLLALASHFPERSLKAVREDLQDESARGLHLLATQLVQVPGQKVVLLIDQFEELFTQTTSEEERQHLIDLLITAITEPQGALIAILTLRADWYDRPMSRPALGRLIVQRQVLVWPMEVQDLRAVIKRPAALPDVGLSFEGNLVGDLLFEVQGEAGALPLLQFTLEQLYERRNEHTLTLQAYREIGGVKGALAKQAEATYAALPLLEQRKLARALFLRLIDPGMTEQDTTRRRAAFTELALPDARQTALLKGVADAFIAARLLTTNEIAGTITVEVSHEALIREWGRLVGWLREAREDIRLQETISEDAAQWEQRGKSGDRLYRGSQLKEAKAWAGRNLPSKQETAFLRASVARRVRSVGSLLIVLVLLAASLGTAGWFLTHQAPVSTLVTNLNDAGPGSLRQAIDTSPARSTITFDASLSGTIELTSNALDISRNLVIRGPATHTIALSSGNRGRIIRVLSGITVTISNLIFQGSKLATGTPIGSLSGFIVNEGTLSLTGSTVADNSGGGIYNEGTLSLTSSTVADNSGGGGGIINEGTLSLTNSIVSGNHDVSAAGGIYNEGTLSLTDSTVAGNSGGVGGGIYNEGTLSLTDSTVAGNSSGGSGGGIFNENSARPISLLNSTVAGNSSGGSGGGIFNDSGTILLTNSTVADNRSGGIGGGIASFLSINNLRPRGGVVEFPVATITFSTLTDNTALAGADMAIKDENPFLRSQVTISESIVADSSPSAGPDISGRLISTGYNLFQDNSGASFDLSTTSQHSTDKLLSANDLSRLFAYPVGLRNNGGPTETYALAQGSPAIDAVPLKDCQFDAIFDGQSRVYADQRGFPRPDKNEKACDIGAYEYLD
jgi:serine/threonine protein kinase